MVADAITTAVVNLLLFGVLVAMCRLVHRDGTCSFLLRGDGCGRRLFLRGAIVGLASSAAYPIIVILLGQGRLDSNADGLLVTLACIVSWGVGFLPLALFEEALFRGYLLQKLLVRLPQWAAVTLSSLLFGAFHAFSYGSGPTAWLGVVNAGLFGVVASLVVIRSRSLLGAIGLHWAWNLAQEVVFLQPYKEIAPLFSLRAREGLWVGADFRPETGLINTGIFVLLGVSMALWLGQYDRTAGVKARGRV